MSTEGGETLLFISISSSCTPLPKLAKAAQPFLQRSLPRVTVDVMLQSRSVISRRGADLPLSSYVMRWTSVFL